MSRPQFHPLTVTDLTPEGEDAVVVTFAVPGALAEAFRYKAGQFLTLRRRLDGEELQRSYSLCSAPHEQRWKIGIREIPNGVFSRWANRELKVGDRIECMPPDGLFCPPPVAEPARHYVFFAVGSGITPCFSIIKDKLATEPRCHVTLIYGNRRASTMMFREELEDLKNRYLDRFALHSVFSREAQDIALYHGRLDGARIREFLTRLIPPATIDLALLCGPAQMLEEGEAALREAGLCEAQILIERFGDVGMTAVRDEVPTQQSATVIVVIDGVQREIQLHDAEQSILDAARAAGLELPFSCKSGVCATCRARVLEGEVHMRRNFALLKSDLRAGIVLACQARPLTPRVVLSFDDR